MTMRHKHALEHRLGFSLQRAWLYLIVVLCSLGCATSPKVDVVQPRDMTLSCRELHLELTRLDEAAAQVEQNTGASPRNTAAALFWLPGLFYTYNDAEKARQLIHERRQHLIDLQKANNCKQSES